MVGFGGDTSYGVGCCGVCIGCLKVVLYIFDHRGGGVVCMLELSPSEVGMVIPYECFVGALPDRGVSVVVIMPGAFACVTRWCVHGAMRIWDGVVGVDDVWLVVVGVGLMFSAAVPTFFASCCNDSPCSPWKVRFSLIIF